MLNIVIYNTNIGYVEKLGYMKDFTQELVENYVDSVYKAIITRHFGLKVKHEFPTYPHGFPEALKTSCYKCNVNNLFACIAT